jgi:hypothetical protein
MFSGAWAEAGRAGKTAPAASDMAAKRDISNFFIVCEVTHNFLIALDLHIEK